MPRLSQILRDPWPELCRMDQDDRFRITIPRWSCPTFSIGHPSHRRHSRHCLSGIYLGFVSDGSPLTTGGDDEDKNGSPLTTCRDNERVSSGQAQNPLVLTDTRISDFYGVVVFVSLGNVFDGFGRDCGLLLLRPLSINLQTDGFSPSGDGFSNLFVLNPELIEGLKDERVRFVSTGVFELWSRCKK